MPIVLTASGNQVGEQLSHEALSAIVNVAICLRQREMPVAHWAQPGHTPAAEGQGGANGRVL